MKRIALAAAGLAIGALATAQLVKDKDWAKSPEAYFLIPQERAEWSRISNDAEAEKFIAAYWARRGGEPFKEKVDRRIAAADEQFKLPRQRGSESARGHIFIVLDSPDRRVISRPGSINEGASPDTGLGAGTGMGRAGTGGLPGESSLIAGPAQTFESWIYDKNRFDPSWGIGRLRVRIAVDAQRGVDSVQNADEVNRVLAEVIEKSIVVSTPTPAASAGVTASHPVVPAAATGSPGVPQTPAGNAAAPLPASTRASLEAILKGAREQGDFWGGSFRSASGDPFYAFEFYFPATNAPAVGAKFGGLVTNESGGEVASFWEDASLFDMQTGKRIDKAYDRSIVLPPGAYQAALGIFSSESGPPLASASVHFRLEPKPSGFEVTPLILANELQPLTKRPGAADPFVFGVEKPIKVEPKGDRIFSKEDSLWYFYGAENPTLAAAAVPTPAQTPAASAAPAAPAPAAAAPRPRLMQRIGVLRDGKAAFAPFTGPAEMQMLSAGYYGSGSEIPLATFQPGYYTFTLNVRDLNAPRDSAAFKGVDRQADFVVLKPDGTLPQRPAQPASVATPRPRSKKS